MGPIHQQSRCLSPAVTEGTAKAQTMPLTVTVAGGKGGVGKTSLALNLALVLARQGHRTLLLDGDLDLANVNIMLGLYPKATLEHAIAGELSLKQVLVPVRDNLDLLPGASGVEGCLAQSAEVQRRFLRQLAQLEAGYDRVVIDTAAGLGNHALHMIAAAHQMLLVITPDPTSLTDAFSLLKVLHRRGYRRQPNIVVNMVRGPGLARSIHQRFALASKRYLEIDCHYLGAIWRDESIAQSVVSQTPVATLPETDPSCRQFWSIAEMLALRWSRGSVRSLGFSRYWIRLLEHKRVQTAPPAATTMSPAAPTTEESPAASLAASWPEHFRAWLQAPQVASLERYHVVNEWLALLGESLDEDMIESLQSGLANMQWSALPEPLRQSAAAHFRQLAELIAPAPAVRQAEPHRYADEVYGSQDRLLSQLRQQPGSQTLSQILEQLREKGDQ